MYCPVYGCNSDSQQKSDNETLHFFRFPDGKTSQQKSRRKAWIEFCKRKAFTPSNCTRICSLHFTEDAYEPAHSPQFLERIGWKEKMSVRLKADALPTINKVARKDESPKTRPFAEKRLREKVLF
jgi:hypothetical protein